MNTSSYTDEQMLNLVNNSITKHTEFTVEEFTGGSISVTSVHKNTRQNYKVNLYFGYKGKNSINRSFDIKSDFYFIWCKAIHLKVMSITTDNLGADYNELNELMKSSNEVVSSKLDSNEVVSLSTVPEGTLQDNLQEKKKSLNNQIAEKIQDADGLINQTALNEWLSYKKYKAIAPITKTINFLSKYEFHIQQQIVDASIMNNYKGLFEPKGGKGTSNLNANISTANDWLNDQDTQTDVLQIRG